MEVPNWAPVLLVLLIIISFVVSTQRNAKVEVTPAVSYGGGSGDTWQIYTATEDIKKGETFIIVSGKPVKGIPIESE